MRQIALCILWAVLLCCCWTPSSVAVEIFVSTAGNDANTCTQARNCPSVACPEAKLTIAGGLSCITAGDTLTIRAGTYAEALTDTIPSGTSTINQTRVRGQPGEVVTLLPAATSEAVIRIDAGAFIILDTLVLDATNSSNVGLAIAGASNNITVRTTTIKNARQGTSCVRADLAASNLTFTGIKVTGCGGTVNDTMDTNPGRHGIALGASSSTVTQSTMHTMTGWALDVTGSSNTFSRLTMHTLTNKGGVRFASSAASNTLVNSIIYNVGTGIRAEATNNAVHHNTVYNAPTQGCLNCTAAQTKNNIFFQTGGILPAGNLTSDPAFTNAAAANFTLTGGSAALDVGAPLNTVTNDFVNHKRPFGNGPDMGAYESEFILLQFAWERPNIEETVSTYRLNRGRERATKSVVTTVPGNVLTVQDRPYPPARWCYTVTAVFANADVSTPSNEVCVTTVTQTTPTEPTGPTTPPTQPAPGQPPVQPSQAAIATFLRPFSANSFWNTAIGPQATMESAGLSSAVQKAVFVEHVIVRQMNGADPLRNVYKSLRYPRELTSATCSTANATTAVNFPIRIPDSFLVERTRIFNSIAVFCDTAGVVAEFGGAGKCREATFFRRCDEWTGTYAMEAMSSGGAGSVTAHGTTDAYALNGDGLTYHAQATKGDGALETTGFRALGGLIRSGELNSVAGTEIPHMLAITVTWSPLHRTPRWPAPHFVCGPNFCRGTNPYLTAGGVLTLPRTYNCRATMQTEPGWKICRAFQKYGALIVSRPLIFSTSLWGLHVQASGPSKAEQTVANEVQATWGIQMECSRLTDCDLNEITGRNAAYINDLNTIWDNAQVLTNSTEEAPKGPDATPAEDPTLPPDVEPPTTPDCPSEHECE